MRNELEARRRPRLPNAREANRGLPHHSRRASAGAAPPQAGTPGEDLKMASAAPTDTMPMFYNTVEPINLDQHGKMKVHAIGSMPAMGGTHAVPLTVDEFPLVQRHYPIVFSVGGAPVPIALMGLNDGVNVFLDENGRARDPNLYIPAYLRRYPFLLG